MVRLAYQQFRKSSLQWGGRLVLFERDETRAEDKVSLAKF
jgi:hypothetical protein